MGVKATDGTGFYRPPAAVYIAEFVECIDPGPRPTFETRALPEEQQIKENTWALNYKLFSYLPVPGAVLPPFINPDTKQQAVVDPRITQKLGPKSNGRKHLRALLQRELQNNEDSDDLWVEAIGKRVMLEFVVDGDKTVLQNIMPYITAPAAAS